LGRRHPAAIEGYRVADMSLVRRGWPHPVLAWAWDLCHARMGLPLCDISVGLGVFETRRADPVRRRGAGRGRVRGEALVVRRETGKE